MHQKDADGMANNVDPDQAAPVLQAKSEFGSILFALTCLSEYFRSLRKHRTYYYIHIKKAKDFKIASYRYNKKPHLRPRLSKPTVKILNILTPKKFAVIILEFKQDGFTEE